MEGMGERERRREVSNVSIIESDTFGLIILNNTHHSPITLLLTCQSSYTKLLDRCE